MQIPQDKSWLSTYRWPLILVALVFITTIIVIIASGVFRVGNATDDEVMIEAVKQSNFRKVVSAYGTLKPKQQRTLISRSAGTLVEIRKRPGERVSKDSVVLVLSNPELDSAVREATLELQKAEADFAALEADLLDQKLTLENELRMLLAEITTKRAELEAQEILAEASIISALDLRKSRMQLHQLELKLELAKAKQKSAEAAFKAKRASGQLAVEQAGYLLSMQQAKLAALNVTAGLDGVLQSQESSLALGQWIRQGEPLGIVSGADNLFAELNVNAVEASSVQLGMPVILSIRGRSAAGEVVRVAPNANQNQVQVDVTIDGLLPDVARANLDIRGDIVIVDQAKSYVLSRPSSYREGRRLKLYVQQPDGDFRLKEIAVLEASENQLLVAKEIPLGTKVILDDPDKWNSKPTITIE